LKKPGKHPKVDTKQPVRVFRQPKDQPQWITGESAQEDLLFLQFQAQRAAWWDDDLSDSEGHALHRKSYTRELKLAAVNWAENTVIRGKKPSDPFRQMKPYKAAKRLRITQTMLKSWSKNRIKIAAQKKHSRRAACQKLRAREPDMEHALFQKFQEARKLGKGIGC
jgi:hypothetical protein